MDTVVLLMCKNCPPTLTSDDSTGPPFVFKQLRGQVTLDSGRFDPNCLPVKCHKSWNLWSDSRLYYSRLIDECSYNTQMWQTFAYIAAIITPGS